MFIKQGEKKTHILPHVKLAKKIGADANQCTCGCSIECRRETRKDQRLGNEKDWIQLLDMRYERGHTVNCFSSSDCHGFFYFGSRYLHKSIFDTESIKFNV